MRILSSILMFLVLIFGISYAGIKDTYKCVPFYIIDGDTLKAFCDFDKNGMIGKSELVKIRIANIDTFESRVNKRARIQAKKYQIPLSEVLRRGRLAKQKLKELLPLDKVFICHSYGKGKYGRLICAIVNYEGIDISYYMVCNGYANPFIVRSEYKEVFKRCLNKKVAK